MSTFVEFPKIARLSREVTITEKIDGTNAAVQIISLGECDTTNITAVIDAFAIFAQSRTRIITPKVDNFGFAQWVADNAPALVSLGVGTHFGEWWGSGIQRGYGLCKGEKHFSLFNSNRWIDNEDWRISPKQQLVPTCCNVVPVLGIVDFSTENILHALQDLQHHGSYAAQGYKNPEGICIYHSHAGVYFKKTLQDDDKGKSFGA